MANSILAGLALDSSIEELLATQALLLEEILNRLPRVDAYQRQLVSLAEASPAVTISSGTVTTVATATGLSNLGAQLRPADAIPMHLSNSGSLHIYDNIRFS